MTDGSRGTLLIWLVAGVIATVALLRLTGSDGGGGAAVRVDGSGGEAGSAGASAAAAGAGATDGSRSSGERDIYVHVAGAVHSPGLVTLPPGSRVAVAVQRAGGLLRRADLAGVNLAARLEDGQQVLVPVRGAAVAAGGAGAGGAAAGAAGAAPGTAGAPKLSLAAATADQLDEIDGIGPTLAERILEYRTEHGGFRSLPELREVEGIGEKRFETLSDALQP
jgi:competence protein ComEA